MSEQSANFETEYSVNQGSVTLPAMELMLTIVPRRRSCMCGNDELRESEGREQIQLEKEPCVRHGRVPGRRVEAHAGIVDEDVDIAEVFQSARTPHGAAYRRS